MGCFPEVLDNLFFIFHCSLHTKSIICIRQNVSLNMVVNFCSDLFYGWVMTRCHLCTLLLLSFRLNQEFDQENSFLFVV